MIEKRHIWLIGGLLIVLCSTALVLWTVARPVPATHVPLPVPTLTEPLAGAPIVAAPTEPPAPPPTIEHWYLAVLHGCGPDYGGSCVRARSGPGLSYPIVLQLRRGIVLRIVDTVERDGRSWYRVGFDEWLRYPDRAKTLYVAADVVSAFKVAGPEKLEGSPAPTAKRIVVDRGSEMLYAYEGDTLFMQARISTGIAATPTPRGTFTIYYKTPTRYMQGPIPGISAKEYDLPGVPWNMYFTKEGAVIHGAYWHSAFGSPHSNGCVNLSYENSRKLYEWADLGTPVIVRD